MRPRLLSTLLHRWLLRGLRPARLAHVRQPEDVGVPSQAVRVVRLPTVQGSWLFAWFIRPDASPHEGSPAVVVIHGWGSNASELLPGAQALRQAGHAILLLDARCHGLSDDVDFTSMPRFAEDLETGLDWLQQQPGIDPGKVSLVGHSVGAAAALLLASRRSDVAGVVGLSTFAHPADMMQRWMQARRIPSWPVGRWILSHVQEVIGARFNDIAPTQTLPLVKAPVLLVHGQGDEIAPIEDLHRLLMAAQGRSVRSLILSDVGHDLSLELERQVLPEVIDFLKASSVLVRRPVPT